MAFLFHLIKLLSSLISNLFIRILKNKAFQRTLLATIIFLIPTFLAFVAIEPSRWDEFFQNVGFRPTNTPVPSPTPTAIPIPTATNIPTPALENSTYSELLRNNVQTYSIWLPVAYVSNQVIDVKPLSERFGNALEVLFGDETFSSMIVDNPPSLLAFDAESLESMTDNINRMVAIWNVPITPSEGKTIEETALLYRQGLIGLSIALTMQLEEIRAHLAENGNELIDLGVDAQGVIPFIYVNVLFADRVFFTGEEISPFLFILLAGDKELYCIIWLDIDLRDPNISEEIFRSIRTFQPA